MVKHNHDNEELRHDAGANGTTTTTTATITVSDATVAAAELSALDRFLPLWIILSAGVGLGLGQLHAVHSFIASTTIGGMNALVGVGLLAMMYPPLASVRWPLVGRAFTQDWRLLAVTSVQNWIIGPGLMFLLSAAFFRDEPGFLAGFSLVGCARCIGMVMIWISLAGGDLEYGAALIAVNSVLTLGLYALYASFLLTTLPVALGLPMQDELHITVGEIAANVGIYMGVPFALAILGWVVLVKYRGAHWYFELYAPRLDIVALLALLFTIVVLFASQSQRILSKIAPVLFAMVPFMIYFAVMFTSTFVLSAKCGADYAQSATLAFTATSNNYELSLGVAVATFGLDSDPAMMSVVAALVEIPTMLLLVWLSLWAKSFFFIVPAAVEAIDPHDELWFAAVEAEISGGKGSFVEVKSPVTSRRW